MSTQQKTRRGSPSEFLVDFVRICRGAAPLLFVVFSLQIPAHAAAPKPSMTLEVSQETHDYIKYRMRAMLETYTQVSAATEQEDSAKVKELIRTFLQANKTGRPARMDSELPEAFRAMNRGVMQQWRQMAQAAEAKDTEQVRSQSLQLLNTCNACHNTFALTPKP